MEVLRNRVDCPMDSDVPRQLRAIKDELAKMKAEAARANEEAERLCKKIAELRGKKERRRTRKINKIESSSTSASSSPDRAPKRKKYRKVKGIDLQGKEEERKMKGLGDMAVPEEDMTTAMEVDSTPVPPPLPTYQPPPTIFLERDDNKRKKEILPPREEWLAVRLPPLLGKVRILDECTLVDKKVVFSREKASKNTQKQKQPIEEPKTKKMSGTTC